MPMFSSPCSAVTTAITYKMRARRSSPKNSALQGASAARIAAETRLRSSVMVKAVS